MRSVYKNAVSSSSSCSLSGLANVSLSLESNGSPAKKNRLSGINGLSEIASKNYTKGGANIATSFVTSPKYPNA